MDSIRIKRGLSKNLPTRLPEGELAFCTDTQELWVGTGSSTSLKKVIDKETREKLEETNAQLIEATNELRNKVDINKLSLAVDVGGNIHIYVDGQKVGSGIRVICDVENTPLIPEELYQNFRFIPDPYNTGLLTTNLKQITITDVGQTELVDNIVYNVTTAGYLNIDFNYNVTNKALVTEGALIVIDGIDFYSWCNSGNVNRFNIDTNKNVDYTVKFTNCKFAKVTSQKSESISKIIFENCEFRDQVTMMNATYTKCFFGGEETIGRGFDGIYPYSNCHFNDCYFYYKCYEGGTGNHVDFIQYGGLEGYLCSNITVDNCRFEMPFLKLNDNVVDYPNACLMIQAERGNLDNVMITNCICNGGGYVFYLHPARGCTIDNAVVRNIEIGCSKRYGDLYPITPPSYVWDNVVDTNSLHVSSIFTDKGKTYVIVTNDTNTERSLDIITDKGVITKVIPAMPTYSELLDNTTFDDLPINIKIEISYLAKFVLCKENGDCLNGKILM